MSRRDTITTRRDERRVRSDTGPMGAPPCMASGGGGPVPEASVVLPSDAASDGFEPGVLRSIGYGPLASDG